MTSSQIIASRLLEEEDFDARDWLINQDRPDVQSDEALFRDLRTSKQWKVRIVHPGGCYGRENCLFHMEHDPLIEFWDMDQFGGEGQFVSRYYWSTLDEDRDNLQLHGLDLQGDEPAWKVGAELMQAVLNWASLVIKRKRNG